MKANFLGDYSLGFKYQPFIEFIRFLRVKSGSSFVSQSSSLENNDFSQYDSYFLELFFIIDLVPTPLFYSSLLLHPLSTLRSIIDSSALLINILLSLLSMVLSSFLKIFCLAVCSFNDCFNSATYYERIETCFARS